MKLPANAFDGCTMPAVAEAIGERWTFLILRGAFSGIEHFEEFQQSLGIARNVLADRLSRLVAHDILTRVPIEEDRRRIRYGLTEKGRALLPVMVALRQWGDRFVAETPRRYTLADRRDGLAVAPVEVRAADGRALGWGDMTWVRNAAD